jgi:hypothetical protein
MTDQKLMESVEQDAQKARKEMPNCDWKQGDICNPPCADCNHYTNPIFLKTDMVGPARRLCLKFRRKNGKHFL